MRPSNSVSSAALSLTLPLALLILALVPAAPADAQDGEALYTAFCESCHGTQGLGGVVGRPIRGVTPCSINEAIDRFILGMEFLDILTPAEIRAISRYLNTFPVDGEDLFIATCLGCHGKEGEGGRVAENVQGKRAEEIFEEMIEEEAMRFLRQCASFPLLNQIEQYLSQVN